MAHLVRPWIVRLINTDTGRRAKKSDPRVRKVKERARMWYGAGVPGQGKRRFPLASDKRVAQKMLADLVSRAERGLALMPDRDEASKPLDPLVSEFAEAIGRKATAKHTKAVTDDVRRVLAGCNVATLADLQTKDLATRVESFVWSLLDGPGAVAEATAAYVGKHAKSFTRWLWRKRQVLDFDPLAGLDLPSQEAKSRRRALSPEELSALFAAAEASPKSFRYVSGPDRAVIYLVAVATGYRAGELAKLTPAHFELDAEVPVVRLKGRATKNKKPAEQPLPPAVAARLRVYLVGRPADRPVWPGTWSKRSADMLKADLAAAGIPVLVDDEAALFHSLRHSYTSLLARSAPVKVTQELARHSTPMLTIGRYSHASMREKAEAVARLPLPGVLLPAAGPFAALSRSELEAAAETLLAALVASLVAPMVAPDRATGGDSRRPSETGQGERASA